MLSKKKQKESKYYVTFIYVHYTYLNLIFNSFSKPESIIEFLLLLVLMNNKKKIHIGR